MPEIMEPDIGQIQPFDFLAESAAYSIRKEKIPHIIHTDVFQKVGVVLLLASLLISLLFVSRLQQHPFDLGDKWKGAKTGFVFCPILQDQLCLSIDFCSGNGVADCNGVVFEINRAPLQPQHFTAAKAVESGKRDRKFNRAAFESLQHDSQLLCIIIVGHKVADFGAGDICGRIVRDQLVLFYCIGQTFSDICVVVQNCVPAAPLLL